ncbi:hypothetical protein A0H81_09827 [Grifola frondosa]|uniref:Uncharacterized protein n=1 Tax=Grifola frondosa TaxID=5627 RepID=A0A1C7M1M6_GRIFR|nr:hypothetical protein A0H81_09827 [Grifola frondosa]
MLVIVSTARFYDEWLRVLKRTSANSSPSSWACLIPAGSGRFRPQRSSATVIAHDGWDLHLCVSEQGERQPLVTFLGCWLSGED